MDKTDCEAIDHFIPLKEWPEERCKHEIRKIDIQFAEATSWGSWMVSAANRRESYVNRLIKLGVEMPHKNLARTASGGKVD